MADEHEDGPDVYRGRIGVILAAGLITFLVLFGAAVLWNSLFHENADISENATQVLSTAIGGIIGVLAGFVGGMEVGRKQVASRKKQTTTPDDDQAVG